MIAVIFEVLPAAGATAPIFRPAGQLKPALKPLTASSAWERFERVTQPGKFLSLSFWRDEAAVAAWRNTLPHRQAKTPVGMACSQVIDCVAQVLRDYGLDDREQAPADSRNHHQ